MNIFSMNLKYGGYLFLLIAANIDCCSIALLMLYSSHMHEGQPLVIVP